MADTKYTYSISGDFPNELVNSDRLTYEIDGSSISSAALSYINTEGDDCDIWFDDPLSGADETALDAVVAAHTGAAYPIPAPQYAESVGNTQTSDTGWSDKVTLVTPSFPPGDYNVEWSSELRSSKNGNDCESQIVIEGVETPVFQGGHDRRNWVPCSGFAQVTLTGLAARTLRFQYRKSEEAVQKASAYIRRASLRISPVEE